MNKVLSQEEINALFSAMSSEELSLKEQPDKSAGAHKIASYDFHCADRISQDQMRSIHLLHENFGRSFASSLSAYLRAFVDVSLASLEHVSYAAFIKALPDPTLFASIGMRPLDSNIALELKVREPARSASKSAAGLHYGIHRTLQLYFWQYWSISESKIRPGRFIPPNPLPAIKTE